MKTNYFEVTHHRSAVSYLTYVVVVRKFAMKTNPSLGLIAAASMILFASVLNAQDTAKETPVVAPVAVETQTAQGRPRLQSMRSRRRCPTQSMSAVSRMAWSRLRI